MITKGSTPEMARGALSLHPRAPFVRLHLGKRTLTDCLEWRSGETVLLRMRLVDSFELTLSSISF